MKKLKKHIKKKTIKIFKKIKHKQLLGHKLNQKKLKNTPKNLNLNIKRILLLDSI